MPFALTLAYVAVALIGAGAGLQGSTGLRIRGNALILLVGTLGVAAIGGFTAWDAWRGHLRRIALQVEAAGRGEVRDATAFGTQRGALSAVVAAAQSVAHAVRAREEHLRENEQWAAITGIVAGVAHEVNNPLAFMRGNIELAQASLDDLRAVVPPEGERHIEEVEEALKLNLQGLDRLARISGNLGHLSQRAGEGASNSVAEIVDGCLLVVHARLGGHTVVHTYIVDVPPVACEPARLSSALLHVLTNAAEAMPDGGTLTVTGRAEGDHVVLTVTDTGPGISARVAPRIFEPFFTTKPDAAGVGLSIARRLVESDGGRLGLAPSTEGAAFRFVLPRAEP